MGRLWLTFCVYLLVTWQAASWAYLRGLEQLQPDQRPDVWWLNKDVPYADINTTWLTSEWFALVAWIAGVSGLMWFGWICYRYSKLEMSAALTASFVMRWLVLTASVVAFCYGLPVVLADDIDRQTAMVWLTDNLSQPPGWLPTFSRVAWSVIGIYLLTLLHRQMRVYQLSVRR